MKEKYNKWKVVTLSFLISSVSLLVIIQFSSPRIVASSEKSLVISNIPTVIINIEPDSVIFEGDVINCTITGNPTIKYWAINNQKQHTTFYNNNPVIFDPEPTPLDSDNVTLTVYVENEFGSNSDSVVVNIKRLYFGDIHGHSEFSDGKYLLDIIYENTINDNYLDFASITDHGFMIPLYKPNLFLRLLKYLLLWGGPWERIKELNNLYYTPGKFTTILGFEWAASDFFPGGYKKSANGNDDVSHINFYYREVYENSNKYSPLRVHTYDDILKAMAEENEKGHQNIGYLHHPLGKAYGIVTNNRRFIPLNYTVNWDFLVNDIQQKTNRNKIIRGVETYSTWGTAIGNFSNLPIPWPYNPDEGLNMLCYSGYSGAWVENSFWEISENKLKEMSFALIASSDFHGKDRFGSAIVDKGKPSGLIAAYSTHNTRGEIWDSMNNGSVYAIHTLKIRANVRFDGQMALGKWISCTDPLNIRISAMSPFHGEDCGGKTMCPYSYSTDELNKTIQDIWLLKKDSDRGKPWIKIIGHVNPDKNMVVVEFEDSEVKENDFYFVAIRYKGQELTSGQDEYMAYLGPVFIDNVEQ